MQAVINVEFYVTNVKLDKEDTQKYRHLRGIYIIIALLCTITASSFMICNAEGKSMNCMSKSSSVKKIKTVKNTSGMVSRKKTNKKVGKAIKKTSNKKAKVTNKKVKKDAGQPYSQDKAVTASSSSTVLGSFYYPFIGTITSRFGSRWGRMHTGIDIAASQGAPIRASADGIISFADWESGYGNLVKINHGNQMQTCYAHCSKILVKEGQRVKKGDIIARVGSTGNSTGPHLHFEIRLNGIAKNPLNYLKK